jgi:muramoyltetrapeptide carboxypeptidase
MSLPRLLPGDTIGVVSTGFAVRAAALRRGVSALRAMGYRVRLGDHVLARAGYLAGSDAERAGDLRRMVEDADVRAVWFARGGFGTARILDRVPWRALGRDPKPLIGYSDLTALFSAVIRRTGQVCLYGPVVSELGDRRAYDARSLRRALAGAPAGLRFGRRLVLVAGRAAGPLAGGNLALLSHLAGTRFAPDLRGALLFLEEVGEPAYRVDRMLTQLEQCGAFRELVGVVVGDMRLAPRRRFPPDRSLDELLGERFAGLGIPVVRGLPVGHVPGKWTLPLGARARLDTRRGSLTFEV